MLIRFMGPGTRLAGGYEWSRQTGMVQDVDAETAAQMLTQPGERFEIDAAEPLLGILARSEAERLLLIGIGSVSELAELKPAGFQRVAEELGANKKMVRAWVKMARTMVEDGQRAGLRPAPTEPEPERRG